MRYYLIAGEASGDLHGSNLIRGLRAEDPEAQFRFFGGDLMSDAAGGTAPLVHYRNGAVMGFSDVLAKAGSLLGNLRACKKDIVSWKPDVVIPVDYPGFNLKIARFCHKRGLKVFYYIAPKTWASRESRNSAIGRWVDRLFIIFPFEIDYFREKGIDAVYAGNPLIDAVDSHVYVRPCEERYIAVLAGSRKGEIKRMMPVCMEVADRLGMKVLIAGAPSVSAAEYEGFIGGRKNVELLFGRTYDILKYADAAIINSGTASLEAALTGTPQVVCWSTGALTAFVGYKILRVFDHIKYISLGNLCLDKLAFKELVQENFTAEKVLEETRRLLDDAAYREAMLADYAEIRRRLGGGGASRAVARAMVDSLKESI